MQGNNSRKNVPSHLSFVLYKGTELVLMLEKGVLQVLNYFLWDWVGSQATILYQNKLIRENIRLKVEQSFKEID